MWLDREIARERLPVTPPAPALQAPVATPTAADPASAEAEAEALLDQYKNEQQTLQSDVKRGCFLYFFAALGLVALSVLAFYFVSKN